MSIVPEVETVCRHSLWKSGYPQHRAFIWSICNQFLTVFKPRTFPLLRVLLTRLGAVDSRASYDPTIKIPHTQMQVIEVSPQGHQTLLGLLIQRPAKKHNVERHGVCEIGL